MHVYSESHGLLKVVILYHGVCARKVGLSRDYSDAFPLLVHSASCSKSYGPKRVGAIKDGHKPSHPKSRSAPDPKQVFAPSCAVSSS
jgi:hypothetical protein